MKSGKQRKSEVAVGALQWRTDKAGYREGKTTYKFEPFYRVCFCTVKHGNQNQLQREVLADKNGNSDQLADHLKPSNLLFTLLYNNQRALGLQTWHKHIFKHKYLVHVCTQT